MANRTTKSAHYITPDLTVWVTVHKRVSKVSLLAPTKITSFWEVILYHFHMHWRKGGRIKTNNGSLYVKHTSWVMHWFTLYCRDEEQSWRSHISSLGGTCATCWSFYCSLLMWTRCTWQTSGRMTSLRWWLGPHWRWHKEAYPHKYVSDLSVYMWQDFPLHFIMKFSNTHHNLSIVQQICKMKNERFWLW